MEIKLIQNLVRLMKRADLTEMEVEDSESGLRVHLRRGSGLEPQPLVNVMQGGGAPGALPAGQMPAALPAGMADEGAAAPPAAAGESFDSPMVGTFYRAASPDADPFVTVGTRIEEDTVVCIIEAMKVMNEIKAEMRGEIVEVLVENGEPIEFGQPLFLIKPGG